MKGNRLRSFEQLKANVGTPFVLITQVNINEFELKSHPFHPIVRYTLQHKKGLSGVHMSDYFRIYFSYHYGGAYHDIKSRSKAQSIANCWKLFNDPNVWVVGMAELHGVVAAGDKEVMSYILHHEAYHPNLRRLKNGKWHDTNLDENNLISNCAWVARPKTDLFKKVNSFAEKRLDDLQKTIKINPVSNFKRCCIYGENFGYPVAWTAILGNIFHPYQAVYQSHINRSMPWFTRTKHTDKSENTG